MAEWISVYCREPIRLDSAGYHVVQADASRWLCAPDADATGLVTVLTGFDEFAQEFPDTAHSLLDVFVVRSRNAMLTG